MVRWRTWTVKNASDRAHFLAPRSDDPKEDRDREQSERHSGPQPRRLVAKRDRVPAGGNGNCPVAPVRTQERRRLTVDRCAPAARVRRAHDEPSRPIAFRLVALLVREQGNGPHARRRCMSPRARLWDPRTPRHDRGPKSQRAAPAPRRAASKPNARGTQPARAARVASTRRRKWRARSWRPARLPASAIPGARYGQNSGRGSQPRGGAEAGTA